MCVLVCGVVSAACLDPGRRVQWPEVDGPAVLVYVRDGAIIRRFDLGGEGGGVGWVDDPETQALIVQVPAGALLEQHSAVDEARIAELSIVEVTQDLSACPEGFLVSEGRASSIEYPLRGVAEVLLVEDGHAIPVEDWPTVLDGLALRAPAHACADSVSEVHPFAQASPLVDAGGHIGSITIDSEDAFVFIQVVDLAYVNPDLALVGFQRSLVLLGRGEGLAEGTIIDLADPSRALLPSPGIETRVSRFEKRRQTPPGLEAVFVVLLNHLVEGSGEDAGFSVVELPVEGRFFGTPRLLYQEPRGFESVGGLALGAKDRFALAQGGRVRYWDGEQMLSVPVERGFSAEAVALSPDEEGGDLYWSTVPAGFFEISLPPTTRPLQHPTPRTGSVEDYCDGLHWSEGAAAERLFAVCSHPTIFERSGEAWVERRSWHADSLLSCTSAERRCGRAQLAPGLGVEHLSSAADDRLAYVTRGCPAVLLRPVDGDRCGEHVEFDARRYQARPQAARLHRIARSGRRLLFGGDAGLLLEVELP